MSLTPAALRVMREKGLTLDDAIEIAEALVPARSSAAERQARYRRRKKASDVTDDDVTRDVTPPLNEGSNPPRFSPSSASADDCPPFDEKLVSVWNETAGKCGFRQSRALNADRKAKLRRRVAEYGETQLLEAVSRLSTSPFHCGQNDREWRADLGWLLRNSENVTKALEYNLPGEPNGLQPRQANLRSGAGARGDRPNRLLDWVLDTEGEGDPEEDRQPDWQGRPTLRAIGQI